MGIPDKKLFCVAALFAAAIFWTNTCFASSDPPFIKTLKGSSQIKAGDSVVVRDENFYDPAFVGKLNKPYYEKNIITLRMNEDTTLMPPNSFTLSVRFSIAYIKYRKNGDSVLVTSTDTLTVNYSNSGTYSVRSSVVFDSAQKVKVTINSITSSASPSTPTSALLGAMAFDVVVQPYSDYSFSCSGQMIKTITLYDTTIAQTGELNVKWPNRTGADEYDLEWAYIDPYALQAGTYGNAASPTPDLIFRNNATRVSTSNLFYNIPMLFPDTGTVYVRVRPVLIKPDGTRIAANWSSDTTTGLGSYYYTGHQDNMNWQSSVTFAEEGKRKAVVQYYDGSLRSRQTVTKDNSTKNTIVAETYYDNQGRPVIQVLPAPTLSTIIQYTRNFNTKVSGGEYDKSLYDTLINPSDYCSNAAPPMDSAAGTAGYYSSNNTMSSSGSMRYVPNGKGYVFTQTEYTQDNTGRISRQGGVGETFKLGSGHETKYSYATADQKEIDALFGTDAGDASHYFKNAVRDANGQYSISYVDMHGRTVATALAGTPANSSLDSLLSRQKTSITESLNNPQYTVIKDNTVMESQKSLMVTDAGPYTFNYDLSPESLQKNSCSNTPICYDCLYDLEIKITDDCNNQKLPGYKPYDTVIHNFSLNSIDTSCTAAAGFHVSFSITLDPGNYEVVKTLSISKYGKDYYYNNVFLKNNLCKTQDQFIQTNRDIFKSTRECSPTCSSCRASIGTWNDYRNNYMTLAGIAPADSAQYRSEAWASYQKALADCDDLCNATGMTDPDDMRQQMLMDVTAPFGQYANPDSAQDIYSMFYTTASPRYKTSGLIYYDDFGKRDTVYDDNDGQYKIPQLLDAQQFARKFKNSWANTLLPYHPEYCKLLRYEGYRSSQNWDYNFETTETYADAVTKGFVNPLSGSGQDSVLMAGSSLPTTYKNKIIDKYNVYTTYSGSNVSMITMAVMMVKCDSSDVTCRTNCASSACGFSSLSCDGDKNMAWKLFKSMYLAAKHDAINEDIYTNTTSCPPANTTPPTPETLFAAHRNPHFYNTATNFGNASGYSTLTSITDPNVLKDSAAKRMTQGYTQNCQAYAAQWMKDLSGCGSYPPDSINLVIIPRLVDVCVKGSDVNHPLGSRDVSPANQASAKYKSFDDVINDYNATHGISLTDRCNADVILAPEPYNAQTSYANAVALTTPDSCTCSKINGFYSEYTLVSGSYASFSDYMKLHYQTTISQADLDTLRTRCNAASVTCRYLVTPITIPPILQCYSGADCKTCNEVNSWHQSFISTYGFTPTATESDSVQSRHNRLYENYMGNHLGIYKTTWEYLDFISQCNSNNNVQNFQGVNNYNSNPNNCVSCDTLQAIINQYFDTLTVSGGSKAEMEQFILSKLQAKQVYSTISDIEQALAACNEGYDKNMSFYGSDSANYLFRGATTQTNLNIGPAGSAFTIELWANIRNQLTENVSDRQPLLYYLNKKKTSGAGGVRDDYYFSNHDCSPGINTLLKGWYLYVDTLNSHHYLFALFADSANNASNNLSYIRFRSSDTLIPHKWYHFAITRTGDSIADFKLYINGVQNSTVFVDGLQKLVNGNITPIVRNPYSTTKRGLLLAAKDYSGISKSKINIKNVRLYKRALLSAEISSDYNNCSDGPTNSDSLKLWLKLNEGTGAPIDYGPDHVPGEWLITEGGCSSNGTEPTASQKKLIWRSKYGKIGSPSCTVHIGNVLCSYPVGDNLLLCGNTTPVFPPTDIPTACADSSFYAVSIGTEQYNAYRDSLAGNFDSLYRNKCMNAYKYESFTVTHGVSEYHYTLYYYDQSGNLVKTIPPQGVNPIRRSTWLDSVQTFRANKQTLVPTHYFATQYRYNTLNQVVAQITPDAGRSDFYYDRLGRLLLSQNAKQKPLNNYSYTKYDALGRITEVGQTTSATSVSASYTRVPANMSSWFSSADAKRAQITVTTYDVTYVVSLAPNITQYNLRNRVSWTALYDTAADANAVINFTAATFYTYDIHGNVDTLLQDYGNSSFRHNSMNWNSTTGAAGGNRWKKMVYSYDLISGKVNSVAYQPGYADMFYHRYTYVAENRLTDAETSSDSIYWEHDGYYTYYKHGPLARSVIGHLQVQGLDYAYTLQGWLKGVNSTTVDPAFDMGGDGMANTSKVARDVYGFALSYYGTADYAPINTTKKVWATGYDNTGFKPLYNGNIAAMQVNIPKLGAAFLYRYTYDQLNRLVGMQSDTSLNTTTNTWSPVGINDYKEAITYDANGNILSYKRRGKVSAGNTQGLMDALSYKYYYTNTSGNRKWFDPSQPLPGDVAALSNRLSHVDDSTAYNSYFTDDIDDQDTANYMYDEIGNMIKATKDSIASIEWTVYGKIKKITKLDGSVVNYAYDASGNRIYKKVGNIETWYVRDATGNVMSVYTYGDNSINSGNLTQTEVDMYGSSRIGMLKPKINVQASVAAPGIGSKYIITFTRGNKIYEMSNHLGNVLVTISDRKLPVSGGGSTVSYYTADVVSATDYSSFGTQLGGRNYSSGSYKYGVNGQEKSTEINENLYTAEYWQYDSRIGKRWNIDPKPMTGLSPYATFSNNPILKYDILGDTARVGTGANGNPTGQLGQQFTFTNDGTLSNNEFNSMQQSFLNNLNQQVNNSGRTYTSNSGTTVNVSLNTNDPLASIINVTFGATGTSNANMQANTIFISLSDMNSKPNVSTHEWLHTAGLMDRYYEVYGYASNGRFRPITLNTNRRATIRMEMLPNGYDNNYIAIQNMMSESNGQITNQQWSIVFAGISERSLNGLGVVSIVLPNATISDATMMTAVRNTFSTLSFSGTQAYEFRNGQQQPLQNIGGYKGNYILHRQNGNIYPPAGRIFDIYNTMDWFNNYINRPVLDGFRR